MATLKTKAVGNKVALVAIVDEAAKFVTCQVTELLEDGTLGPTHADGFTLDAWQAAKEVELELKGLDEAEQTE